MDSTSMQTVISAEVEITGTLKSAGSVRIDGKVEGEVHCEKDAIIGKSATIKGNLVVNSIVVEGAITGNVTARDRIELKASARMTGDIKAKRLTVEDGVTFVGRSDVNPSGVAAPAAGASAPAPAAPAAAGTPPQQDRSGFFAKR